MSGRSRRRGEWGEQEEQRRDEREGRRERRRALWAWKERVGVTRVTSEWEGKERREEEREEMWEEEAMANILIDMSKLGSVGWTHVLTEYFLKKKDFLFLHLQFNNPF